MIKKASAGCGSGMLVYATVAAILVLLLLLLDMDNNNTVSAGGPYYCKCIFLKTRFYLKLNSFKFA
jgi:hypothetical protein